MKTTEFIVEYAGIGDDAESMGQDHEVQLARQDCYVAAENAIALHHMLKEIDSTANLEAWVCKKLSMAAEFLREVKEYFDVESGASDNLLDVFNFESAELQYSEMLGEAQLDELNDARYADQDWANELNPRQAIAPVRSTPTVRSSASFVVVNRSTGQANPQKFSSRVDAERAASKMGGFSKFKVTSEGEDLENDEEPITELSKDTLQSYANKSKRDYNSTNAWARDEGMGPYKERKASAGEGSWDNSEHWSTKSQDKRVSGLQKAKARGVTPTHKTGGAYVTKADLDRSAARDMSGPNVRESEQVDELDASTMQSYLAKRKETTTPNTMRKAGNQAQGVRTAHEKIHDKGVTSRAIATGDARVNGSGHEYGTRPFDESFPHDVDHMRKNTYRNGEGRVPVCPTCNGNRFVWTNSEQGKTPDHPWINPNSATVKSIEIKCPTCDGGRKKVGESARVVKDAPTAHKVGDTVWAKHPTDKSKTVTGTVKRVGRTMYDLQHKDGSTAMYPHKDVSADYEALRPAPKGGVQNEGRWVAGPGGVPLDRQGNPKVAPVKEPRAPAGSRRDSNGFTKDNYNTIWRKVENVVGQIFPDGDPIDWLAPWLKRQGVEEFRVGEVLEKAAKLNGYKDMYAYWDSFKDDTGYNESSDSMKQIGDERMRDLQARYKQAGVKPSSKSANDQMADHAKSLLHKLKKPGAEQVDELSQDTARNYAQKANASQKDLVNQTWKKGANTNKLNAKIKNRQTGLNRAQSDKRYYKDRAEQVDEDASPGGTSAGAMATGIAGAKGNKPGTGKPKNISNLLRKIGPKIG